MRRGGNFNLAEVIAFNAIDVVKARKPFVDNHKVGLDEISCIKIVEQNFAEEGFRFCNDGKFEMAIVLRIKITCRRVVTDIAKAKPLACKITN